MNGFQRSLWILTVICLVSRALFAQNAGAPPASLREQVRSLVDREYPGLFDLYRHLHTHPELSLHEEKTGQRVAEELKKAGLEVTGRVGGYGVVGVLRNGSGPRDLVRTDLDAVPVK